MRAPQLCFLPALLSLALAAPQAGAQESGGGVFPPTSEEYQVLWRRIESFREKGDWEAVREGLEKYVELLEDPEVNYVVTNGASMALGPRELLRRYVDELPDPVRRRWLPSIDRLIEKRWQGSAGEITSEDRSLLRHRLLRDYPFASFRATVLREEVDANLLEGDWSGARRALEALLSRSDGEEPELPIEDRIRAHVLFIQTSRLLGDREAARANRRELSSLLSRESVSVEDLPEAWRPQLRSALEPGAGPSAPPGASRETAYRSPLAPFHEAGAAASYRLGGITWRSEGRNPELGRFVDERRTRRDGSARHAADVPLPYHPVARGSLVVFQDDERLLAYDLTSGLELWTYLLGPAHVPYNALRAPLLSERLCVFVHGNKLHAMDIRTAQPLWSLEVGYDRRESELTLSQRLGERREPRGKDFVPAFDISPAIFFDGDIIVLVAARLDSESLSYLVRLRPDGSERWRAYLGASQSPNFLGLGATGSPPRVVGDTVLCLTNLGFVAAADAHDGTLLWIKEYPRLASAGLKEAIRDENRFHPNPIVPAGDDEILVAPADSPFLLALRREDGSLAWRHRRERHSTLLGRDDARCYLAGLQVSAVSLEEGSEGKAVWTRSLEDETLSGPSSPATPSAPLGRAFLVPGKVLVSTHRSLVHIDAPTGEVLGRDLWGFRGGGGNLLLVRDELAVVHPNGFLVYNELDDEKRRIATLPVQRDESVLERTKFRLRSGDVEGGLATLETWLRTKPTAPEPNSPLDRLYLDVAEVIALLARSSEPRVATRLLQTRVDVEVRPRRKVTAAIELALHLERLGDKAGALGALHQALFHDVPRTEYSPDSVLEVPSETFIRDRILALRQSAPPGENTFAAVEEAARADLEEAHRRGVETKTAVSYLELLRRWPYTRAAAQTYKELSRYYLTYENYSNAAHFLLEYLEDFPGAEDFVEVSLKAANLLYQSGKREEAKRLYLSILESHPDTRVEGVHGASGETVQEYVGRRLSDPGVVEVDVSRVPDLRFPAKMLWRSPADLRAINRTFLFPAGASGIPTPGKNPPELDGKFITQSNEIVQCRDLSTGLPLWTLHLRMIPGFVLDSFASEFRFARSGEREILGRFVGSLLVLHDHKNIFALDPESGAVRWHVPFGDDRRPPAPGGPPPLSERLRGVLISEGGIFATSNQRMLRAFNLDGEKMWERRLGFDVAREPPLEAGDLVYVLEAMRLSETQNLHGFDSSDGAPSGTFRPDDGETRHFQPDPLALGRGLTLLPFRKGSRCELELVDLAAGVRFWSYGRDETSIEDIFYFREQPNEVIAVLRGRGGDDNGRPRLVGISLRDGRELWRYDKFDPSPSRPTRLTVYRDADYLYVVHGREELQLLALQVSRGANRGVFQVYPVWKPEQVRLGTYFGITRQKSLEICGDSVIFPDTNTVSVYDKLNGKTRSEPQLLISRFLAEKGSFTSALIDGHLVLLTDGGDCAYASDTDPVGRTTARRTLGLLRAYLKDPSSMETLVPLALDFFRQGTARTVRSAIDLLDRALASEDVLSSTGREDQELLAYLLDGFKEEAMKLEPPEAVTPAVELDALRMWKAPEIDGELDENWNYAYRTLLTSPRYIGRIPGPTPGRDWEGEEDLSAVLYTGWDDEFFYFALDVEDDVLQAYDRDEEFWRGDCLLIGTDPENDGGYRRSPGDQLMTLALTLPKRKKEDKDRPGEQGEEGEEDEDENQPEGEFSVKRKGDDTGAIYEVALPWGAFSTRYRDGGRPPKGATFGLSLLLIDDDTGGGATKTLSINPCHLLPRSQKSIWVWKYLVPEFFPKVTLR